MLWYPDFIFTILRKCLIFQAYPRRRIIMRRQFRSLHVLRRGGREKVEKRPKMRGDFARWSSKLYDQIPQRPVVSGPRHYSSGKRATSMVLKTTITLCFWLVTVYRLMLRLIFDFQVVRRKSFFFGFISSVEHFAGFER